MSKLYQPLFSIYCRHFVPVITYAMNAGYSCKCPDTRRHWTASGIEMLHTQRTVAI